MSEQKSRTVNSTVWMAKNRAYSETCYFGNYATAVAWARGGTVVPVEIQHYTSPALRVPRTDMLAEAVRMIQGYKRAGWLTNPAAGEQAIDFISRASHEPAEATGIYESAWVIEGMWSSTAYPEYWVGSSAWSSDPYKALRFASKQSAQQAADMMLVGINHRVACHEFAGNSHHE